MDLLKRFGITKLYVEVYRGGTVVEKSLLERVRDGFTANEIEVAGGIATISGCDFGVRQVDPLTWFNWQNEKTRRDLERVVRMAVQVFDEFIVDDFLCTGDVSEQSEQVRGDRTVIGRPSAQAVPASAGGRRSLKIVEENSVGLG